MTQNETPECPQCDSADNQPDPESNYDWECGACGWKFNNPPTQTREKSMIRIEKLRELGNRKSVESSKMREWAFRQMMDDTELLWTLDEMDSEEREQTMEVIQETFDDEISKALELLNEANDCWNRAGQLKN